MILLLPLTKCHGRGRPCEAQVTCCWHLPSAGADWLLSQVTWQGHDRGEGAEEDVASLEMSKLSIEKGPRIKFKRQHT